MKKPINKCKDKSFVKILGVSGYLINKKGEIFSEFKGEVMKPSKVATGYSSSERAFIRAVGMTAFNITMQKLINDEKARNNGNGDDK